MKKFLALLLVALMVVPFGMMATTSVSAAGNTDIYVKDGGTGDGTTADKAVGSLSAANQIAAGLTTDVTIKFVGTVTEDGTAYTDFRYNEPAHTNKITWKEILATKTDVKLAKPGFTHWFTDTFAKTLFSICYRFRVRGSKKLPKTPCIIVANHRSAIDGMLITYNFSHKINKDIFFFAKEKHWRSKIAKFFARKNNIILMDINKNVRQSLQEMCAVLQKGKHIIIFPEGTRSKDNKMKKFKETFAILSKELNVPVVPVAIAGSESACYGKTVFPRFWKKIDVDIMDPVMPTEEQSVESFRDKVASLIEKRLKR